MSCNTLLVLLPNLPIRTLHHNILELNGHREAGVDLKPERRGTGVGGICVVGGLYATKPDLQVVATGARTPLSIFYESGDSVATPFVQGHKQQVTSTFCELDCPS